MTLLNTSVLLVVAPALIAIPCAASPAIGVASALGTFLVNSSQVEGNANLFDGSRIRTDKASSKVYLTGGASLVLGADSAGTIYKDHFTLNWGAAKIANLSGYSIQANGFEIRADKPSSQAIVRFTHGTVEVAALTGSVNVFSRTGALLRSLSTGTASAFQSGLSQLPSGASTANNNNRKRRAALLYLMSGAALAGLGLATDALLQPTSP